MNDVLRMSSESESCARASSSTYQPTYYRNLYHNKRAAGGSDASCEITGDSNQEESGDDHCNNSNLIQDDIGGRKRGNNGNISSRLNSYDSGAGGNRYSHKRPKLTSDFNNSDYNNTIISIQSEILNGTFPHHSINDEDEALEDLHSMAVEWSSDDSNGEKLAYRDDITNIPTTTELSVAAVLLLDQHSGYIDRNRNGDRDDSDDHRSIATSLFVEVASVDECGSYQGYGGASESEKDDDRDCDDDGAMSDYFSLDTVGKNMLSNDNNGTINSFDNRNKSFEDGYDGASETGRAETEVDDDMAEETDTGSRHHRRDKTNNKHQKDSHFSSNSSNGSLGSMRRGVIRKSKQKNKKLT